MNIKQKLAVFGTGIAGVGIGSLGLTAAFASPGSSPAVGPAAAATSPAQVATTVAPVSPSLEDVFLDFVERVGAA